MRDEPKACAKSQKVGETPESRRGETWTCAEEQEIRKERKVTINWMTGASKKRVFKMGSVFRTLTSVDSLQEKGHDLILMKNHPRIFQRADR